MVLEVRLLGTVEVHRDGTRGRASRRQQLRTLLAYPPTHARTSRPIDGIIDALWPMAKRGGAMPTDPRPTVHTYASRIRSGPGHDSIVTPDGGYALGVAPVDVDVGLFEALVRSAGEPGCSAVRRVEVLDKALALWRGQALDGFHDREWARPDATRLQEMRGIAEDDRGRGAAGTWRCDGRRTAAHSCGVDQSASGADPCAADDCVAASGRQAEALRVFQQYRRRSLAISGWIPETASRSWIARSPAASARRPTWPAVAAPCRGTCCWSASAMGSSQSYIAGTPALGRTRSGHQAIRSELADRPEFVRRFETEAQLVANLEHPHIVPLYDFWRTPGCAYLVMRLFPEGTLEDLILRGTLAAR